MHVLKTMQEDGVATLIISIGDDDHQFEVWADGDTTLVEYQETLSWRGQIHVSDPDETIYKELMVSEQMTEFLNENGCDSVKRAEPKS
jgi:arabinogalactan endo-1,4-beta-galactosidase